MAECREEINNLLILEQISELVESCHLRVTIWDNRSECWGRAGNIYFQGPENPSLNDWHWNTLRAFLAKWLLFSWIKMDRREENLRNSATVYTTCFSSAHSGSAFIPSLLGLSFLDLLWLLFRSVAWHLHHCGAGRGMSINIFLMTLKGNMASSFLVSFQIIVIAKKKNYSLAPGTRRGWLSKEASQLTIGRRFHWEGRKLNSAFFSGSAHFRGFW